MCERGGGGEEGKKTKENRRRPRVGGAWVKGVFMTTRSIADQWLLRRLRTPARKHTYRDRCDVINGTSVGTDPAGVTPPPSPYFFFFSPVSPLLLFITVVVFTFICRSLPLFPIESVHGRVRIIIL